MRSDQTACIKNIHYLRLIWLVIPLESFQTSLSSSSRGSQGAPRPDGTYTPGSAAGSLPSWTHLDELQGKATMLKTDMYVHPGRLRSSDSVTHTHGSIWLMGSFCSDTSQLRSSVFKVEAASYSDWRYKSHQVCEKLYLYAASSSLLSTMLRSKWVRCSPWNMFSTFCAFIYVYNHLSDDSLIHCLRV